MIKYSLALLASLLLVSADQAQTFAPPSECPTCLSAKYPGGSPNGSLPLSPIVPGQAYDRFITIWLENTDFASAAASPSFQKLAAQGILLTSYHGVTHPSEPNYVAAMAGDFFGMADDDFYAFPTNVSSMVDLLENKNVSWASYQEDMPRDGDGEFKYTSPNYINATAGNYTYYVRKHDPHIIFNSVASQPDRALRVRNFNDFAVDVNSSALPQHVWITPNLVNDAHDTDVTFVSAWLDYFMTPLLTNPKFNSNRTLIQITFDENESYSIQNTVYTVLLGGAIPTELKGTNDSTFYTHYSMMSSVQNNWGLGNLGRQDTNSTVNAVFSFQANKTGYKNPSAPNPEPLLNLTGIFPGPANVEMWTPVLAPNTKAKGAGNGSTFYNDTATDLSFTSYTPQNLTAMGVTDPDSVNPNYTYTGDSIVNASNKPSDFPSAAATSLASKSAAQAQAAATSGGATKMVTGGGASLLMVGASILALL